MNAANSGFDLVLKGGRVIDPATGVDALMDVGIKGKLISAIETQIDPRGATTLNVNGLLVTPGLVDLHVHVYYGATFYGLRPDEIGRAGGVTTMLDAGSAGSMGYRGFKEFIVDRSKVRVLALVNLSSIGLVARSGELLNPAYADVDGAVRAIKEFPGTFIGAKIRNAKQVIGDGEQGYRHTRMAVELAERAGTPYGSYRFAAIAHCRTAFPTQAG